MGSFFDTARCYMTAALFIGILILLGEAGMTGKFQLETQDYLKVIASLCVASLTCMVCGIGLWFWRNR